MTSRIEFELGVREFEALGEISLEDEYLDLLGQTLRIGRVQTESYVYGVFGCAEILELDKELRLLQVEKMVVLAILLIAFVVLEGLGIPLKIRIGTSSPDKYLRVIWGMTVRLLEYLQCLLIFLLFDVDNSEHPVREGLCGVRFDGYFKLDYSFF